MKNYPTTTGDRVEDSTPDAKTVICRAVDKLYLDERSTENVAERVAAALREKGFLK